MSETSKGEKPYWCDLCGYETHVYTNWQAHLNRHSGEKPFKCRHCPQAFPSPADLNRHERYHSDARPFKCTHCSYATKTYGDLKAHIKRHSTERPHKCSVCSYASKTAGDLRKHVLTHSNHKPFKCPICPFATKIAYILHNHMRRHTGEKPYTCESCSFSTRHQYSLVHHVQLVHCGINTEKKFKCEQCSYASRKKQGLSYHVRTVHSEQTFSCKMCHKKFSDEFSLKKHRSVIHEREEEVICPICKKTYCSKASFLTHIRRHQPKSMLQCKKCPKTFVCEGSLRRHMKAIHIGSEMQVVCRLCGKTFENNIGLKKHIAMVHEREPHLYISDANREQMKQYLHMTCPFCFLPFTSLLRLQKHVEMHKQTTDATERTSDSSGESSMAENGNPSVIYVDELPDHVVHSNQLTTQTKVCLFDLKNILTSTECKDLKRTRSIKVTESVLNKTSAIPHKRTQPANVTVEYVDASDIPAEIIIKTEPVWDTLQEVVQNSSINSPNSSNTSDPYALKINDVRSCLLGDAVSSNSHSQMNPIEIKPEGAFSLREIAEMSNRPQNCVNLTADNASYSASLSAGYQSSSVESRATSCVLSTEEERPVLGSIETHPGARQPRTTKSSYRTWFGVEKNGQLTMRSKGKNMVSGNEATAVKKKGVRPTTDSLKRAVSKRPEKKAKNEKLRKKRLESKRKRPVLKVRTKGKSVLVTNFNANNSTKHAPVVKIGDEYLEEQKQMMLELTEQLYSDSWRGWPKIDANKQPRKPYNFMSNEQLYGTDKPKKTGKNKDNAFTSSLILSASDTQTGDSSTSPSKNSSNRKHTKKPRKPNNFMSKASQGLKDLKRTFDEVGVPLSSRIIQQPIESTTADTSSAESAAKKTKKKKKISTKSSDKSTEQSENGKTSKKKTAKTNAKNKQPKNTVNKKATKRKTTTAKAKQAKVKAENNRNLFQSLMRILESGKEKGKNSGSGSDRKKSVKPKKPTKPKAPKSSNANKVKGLKTKSNVSKKKENTSPNKKQTKPKMAKETKKSSPKKATQTKKVGTKKQKKLSLTDKINRSVLSGDSWSTVYVEIEQSEMEQSELEHSELESNTVTPKLTYLEIIRDENATPALNSCDNQGEYVNSTQEQQNLTSNGSSEVNTKTCALVTYDDFLTSLKSEMSVKNGGKESEDKINAFLQNSSLEPSPSENEQNGHVVLPQFVNSSPQFENRGIGAEENGCSQLEANHPDHNTNSAGFMTNQALETPEIQPS